MRRRAAKQVRLDRWVVWTDFTSTGKPLAGKTFTDRTEAAFYASVTGGRLEYIGAVYSA